MSDEAFTTPSFCKNKKDFYTLLKERIAKSSNNIEKNEYEKILHIKERHHKKHKKKFLSHKFPHAVPDISPKKDENIARSNIIKKNEYTRADMFKFLGEKEKAFKGKNLEDETIESD